jgi:hypothetical protein
MSVSQAEAIDEQGDIFCEHNFTEIVSRAREDVRGSRRCRRCDLVNLRGETIWRRARGTSVARSLPEMEGTPRGRVDYLPNEEFLMTSRWHCKVNRSKRPQMVRTSAQLQGS